MIELKDRIGERYGRWIVKCYLGSRRSGAYFECLCDCGALKEIKLNHLTSGRSASCGCLRRELQTIHGQAVRNAETREHQAWMSIKQRCLNPKNPAYNNYGGRGITVCAKWRDDFRAFIQDMGMRPPNTSIGRINNDGHYEPGNCRWETKHEQSRNKRDSIVMSYDGEKANQVDWALRLGVSRGAFSHLRKVHGYTPDEALRAMMMKQGVVA